jgi:hypothetical protein
MTWTFRRVLLISGSRRLSVEDCGLRERQYAPRRWDCVPSRNTRRDLINANCALPHRAGSRSRLMCVRRATR